jgi:cephalosporin hydroxylase
MVAVYADAAGAAAVANETNDIRFFGREYIAALQEYYPELGIDANRSAVDRILHVGIIAQWMQSLDRVGVDAPDRLQRITERPWKSERSAWLASGLGNDVRYAGARAYKGLIVLKPAIDLVLYSNLIWELQPRTIIEFGSLQGGSALWFADQLEVLCGHGEVHSFELYYRCISPRAAHQRLRFHEADLREMSSLSAVLPGPLPHPWLVVDDAHENLENLIPYVTGFMLPGDYYVVEDVFCYHSKRVGRARAAFGADRLATAVDRLGFRVDTKYTDAFGLNVTASPNGWLRKV